MNVSGKLSAENSRLHKSSFLCVQRENAFGSLVMVADFPLEYRLQHFQPIKSATAQLMPKKEAVNKRGCTELLF